MVVQHEEEFNMPCAKSSNVCDSFFLADQYVRVSKFGCNCLFAVCGGSLFPDFVPAGHYKLSECEPKL